MKKHSIMRFAALFSAFLMILSMAACGGKEDPKETTGSGKSDSASLVSFVAADKSNWDKEINMGDKAYKFAVEFKEDGTVELKGICQGHAEAASGGQQGPGGSGQQEETQPPETQPPMSDAEKEAASFTKSGSWTLEKGYGYTVTLDGETTKTNYDKASARHIFHIHVNNGGESAGLVEFQGKDTNFRKELAADYQDFEVRDAEFIFEAITINGNNPNSTHLYLEKDGTANALTYQGSSPTYKRGTWKKNADNSLSILIDGETVADYCDVAGKEGYRVIYNSDTMYSNSNAEYTNEDFDGKTVKTLYCAEGDYTFQLTDKGKAVLYKGEERQDGGTYTENGSELTIVYGGETFKSENGVVTLKMTVSSGSSGTEDIERSFPVDGSQPEAQPGGEGQPGGESGGEGQQGGESGGEGQQGGESQPNP